MHMFAIEYKINCLFAKVKSRTVSKLVRLIHIQGHGILEFQGSFP